MVRAPLDKDILQVIIMRIYNKKLTPGRLPVGYLFLTGFVVGILFVIIGKSVLLKSTGLLNEYVLYDMKNMTVDNNALFLFVTGKRLKEILFLAALATTNLGLVTVSAMSIWYGAAIGTFWTAAVIRYGLKGVILVLVSGFPQYVMYIPVIFFFLGWCEQICREIHQNTSVESRKGLAMGFLQLVLVIIIIIIGCALESYVNPFVLQKFLEIF